MKTTLEVLECTRELLDKSFIKWRLKDNKGGFCQLGALQECSLLERDVPEGAYYDAMSVIDRTARDLFPELKGCLVLRQDPEWSHKWPQGNDVFDLSPGVYVNNQLGKEAILKVYDKAIADLKGQSK